MSSSSKTLRIEFATEEDFQSEYVRNLSNGGVFVATDEPMELRSSVRIELGLAWCGEEIGLDGEVVHCVTPEMTAAGGIAGLAVQFHESARALREQLEPYVKPVEANEQPTGAERRQSPRSPARVKARIEIEEEGKTTAEYRTRNISTTGMLLSDEGRPLPVGEVMNVAIQHPVTGETMEVAGRVVRHLQSESGGIAGMGVQFDVPDDRQSEVSDFLADVRAAEHSRHLGGISGPIDELGPERTLRMFAGVVDEGTLVLTLGAEEGLIGFRKGRFTGARLGRSAGPVALRKLLAWREGQFELHARLDDPELDKVSVDLDELIERTNAENEKRAKAAASRQVESAQRRAKPARRIEPGTAFAVMHELIDADTMDLGKVEEAVLDLAAVGMSVARMMEVIPENELEVYNSIHALMERGFIAIV